VVVVVGGCGYGRVEEKLVAGKIGKNLGKFHFPTNFSETSLSPQHQQQQQQQQNPLSTIPPRTHPPHSQSLLPKHVSCKISPNFSQLFSNFFSSNYFVCNSRNYYHLANLPKNIAIHDPDERLAR